MKFPILAYGDPILKRKATAIERDEYPHIKELVENMFETMYAARGVGLAAPQIGLSMRLFVIDATPFSDDDDSLKRLLLTLKFWKKKVKNGLLTKAV